MPPITFHSLVIENLFHLRLERADSPPSVQASVALYLCPGQLDLRSVVWEVKRLLTRNVLCVGRSDLPFTLPLLGITLQKLLQIFCTLKISHLLRMGEQKKKMKKWYSLRAVRQHNSSQLFTYLSFYVRETSVFFKLLLFGIFCLFADDPKSDWWRIQFISEFLFYKVISWDL